MLGRRRPGLLAGVQDDALINLAASTSIERWRLDLVRRDMNSIEVSRCSSGSSVMYISMLNLAILDLSVVPRYLQSCQ